MAWTNQGKFRVVNPLAKIGSGNAGDLIKIYQPGTLNPSTIENNITYSGIITNLRAKISVPSLIQKFQIPPQEDYSTEEYAGIINQYETMSPKKGLEVLMKTSDLTTPVQLVLLLLFNRPPFYVIDLLSYLTNTVTLDIASDCEIFIRSVDLGWGNLIINDSVLVWGSVIEEQENAQSSAVVINTNNNSSITLDDPVLAYNNDVIVFDNQLLSA